MEKIEKEISDVDTILLILGLIILAKLMG